MQSLGELLHAAVGTAASCLQRAFNGVSNTLAGAVILGIRDWCNSSSEQGHSWTDSAIPDRTGEYSHSQTTTLALLAFYYSSWEDTNDKRICISKALPKTWICIKFWVFFLNHRVGILNVCGLENILGSSVGEKSNGITFATFLSHVLRCSSIRFSLVLHGEVTLTGVF